MLMEKIAVSFFLPPSTRYDMLRRLIQLLKVASCFALLLAIGQPAYGQITPQIIDSTLRITTLLPSTYRPLDSSLVAFVDQDTCFYYETSPTIYVPGQNKNWYFETGTYLISKATQLTTNYGRRTPIGAIGKAQGGTANYRFDIHQPGKYLVYVYLFNTLTVTDNAYLSVHSKTAKLDSLRYNMLKPGEDVPTYINLGLVKQTISRANDGAWLPMSLVNIAAADTGNKALTVTLGGDSLTVGPLRVDAVRIMRSNESLDLEFGRRPRLTTFDSARVPESFPVTTVGNQKSRVFKFWNMGTATVGINSITSTNGQFNCSTTMPVGIAAGQSANITINFAPTKSGTIIDTLVVNSTDAKEPSAKWYMIGTAAGQLYLTVDQTPGLQPGPGLYAHQGVDTNYYETPTDAMVAGTAAYNGNDGLYNNTGSSQIGGTNRVTPNAVGGGSPAGASGNYIFDVPVTGPYLVYVYLINSINNSANHLLTVQRFGEGTIADSVRFSGQAPGDNVPNFITAGLFQTFDSTFSVALNKYVPNPNADGAWLPLTCVNLFKGNDAVTVKWGADALTPAYFRFDAVRILRSASPKTLQFGRQEKIGFTDSRPVPELFPQTTLGSIATKPFKFWSLGTSAVTITSITSKTGRFVCSTPLPVTIQPGQFASIGIQYLPFQEETTTDTLTILSDDTNRPTAKWIMQGEGINWNFILNASNGGVEPHYNAPGSPSSDKYAGAPYFNPIYTEIPTGWLNSALNGSYTYPINGGNVSSRVNTASGQMEVNFKFMIPPEKSGTYLLEYNGPTASSNAHEADSVDLITPFRADTQRVINFNSRTPAGSVFSGVGPNWAAVPFEINGGDTTKIRFHAINAQSPVEYVRMDLLRVRKVPTKVTMTVAANVGWGSVSTIDSVRTYLGNYRLTVPIRDISESKLILYSVSLAVSKSAGKPFKLVNPPPPNQEVAAVQGVYNLKIDFLPDTISAAYVDTLVITSNAPGDTIRKVPLAGAGVGTQIALDNSDLASTAVSPTVVDSSSDPIVQTKWQRVAGSGYNNDRLYGRIYQMGAAYFEWFPTIPLLGKPIGTTNKFTISIRSAPGSSISSPAARYIIYEATGKIDTVIVNQNGLGVFFGGQATFADSGFVLTNGGSGFTFRRGGKDSHGGSALYGYIRLENDSARVTKWYKDNAQPNYAKDSGYVVRADAIVLNEIQTPNSVVEKKNSQIPVEFSLSQNYPNPFNPSTTIEFALPRMSKVYVIIYDILGREVVRLIDGEQKDAGNYRMRWDSQNRFNNSVATGVYFYRLQAGGFVSTKKMILLK